MARILLYKTCKFSDKIYYNYGDNKFFVTDCFLLAHPVDKQTYSLYSVITILCTPPVKLEYGEISAENTF